MRKSLSECKEWVVVMFHGGKYATVLESYSNEAHAEARAALITRATCASAVAVWRELAITKEQEGKWAWNKSIPY